MKKKQSLTRRKFLKKSIGYCGYVYGGSLLNYKKIDISPGNEFDIIIKSGNIIDGTGSKAFKADIGISKDTIIEIGDLSQRTSAKTLNADGYYVSPGFIDIHTHTGMDLLVNPNGESKIRQGVTTEIGGQCGGSAGPWNKKSLEKIKKNMYEEYELDVDWIDLDGFFNRLEKNKCSVNLATMVGHGTIRDCAMGMDDRNPTAAELREMKRLLTEAVESGVCGLSTGLEYTPGSFAKTDEIIELSKLVSKFNLTYATHIRNEDDRVLEAIEEALLVAKQSGASIQISHLKAIGKRNYPKVDKILDKIENARKSGININFDRYPYIAYSTGLSSLFPLWAREGGNERFIERLKDSSLKNKIKNDVLHKINLLGDWNKAVICNAFNDKDDFLAGKQVGDLAQSQNKDPFELAVELIITNENRISIVGFGMDEESTKKILSHPLGMIGSDGAIAAPYGKLKQGKPHPRFYGTFPRAIGYYCREQNIFDLPVVIKKITSMPAEKIGIKKRGKIKKSYFADITIFDYNTIIDKATFADPHQYPEGIKNVLVNGEIVIKGREHTGLRPGRVLRFS